MSTRPSTRRGAGLRPGRLGAGLPSRRVPPGTSLTARRAARFLLHVAYKPVATDWLGFQAWPSAAEGLAWHRFVRHGHGSTADRARLPRAGPPLLERGDPGRGGRTLPAAGHDALAPGRRGPAGAGAGAVPRPARAPLTDADRPRRRTPWWKNGVLYQIYPRSFADSNGDGVGDLPGIIDHLDHLEWLGVDGIWLSPITVSPNADWGYDVADYLAVRPGAGNAGRRRPADRRGRPTGHPRPHGPGPQPHQRASTRGSSRPARRATARHRNWYVWADPKPDGSPPNNWVSSFGGPAWTLDEGHRSVLPPQPSAPSSPTSIGGSDEVRAAFDGIIAYWLDRGVAGFRIDVCNIIIKDALLRDNPPATEDGPVRRAALRPAAGLQRQPARGPRGAPALAPAGRPATRGACWWGRRRSRQMESLAAYYGTVTTSCIWPSTSRSSARHSRRRSCVPSSRRIEAGPAARGLAGVDRIQPRHVPVRHPVGRG